MTKKLNPTTKRRKSQVIESTRYFYEAQVKAWDERGYEDIRLHDIIGEVTNISDKELLATIRTRAVNRAFSYGTKINYVVDIREKIN